MRPARPGIDAGDSAAILADGASQVDYVTVPPGWTEGTPITGQQLWPGAAVDALGEPTDWPGWTELPDGSWILDPLAPFYDLRLTSVIEFRVNPTISTVVDYPPASEECGPYNPDVDLRVLKTHDDVEGDAVAEGDVIDYRFTITNDGTSPATGVTFSDELPEGLVVVPGSPSGPPDWTFTITADGLEGAGTDPLLPGTSIDITYQATVSELPQDDPAVVVDDLTNQVCVDSTEPDMDTSNNCDDDTVKTKSIALQVGALCVEDTALPELHDHAQQHPGAAADGRDHLVDGRGLREPHRGNRRGRTGRTALRWCDAGGLPDGAAGLDARDADHRPAALAGRFARFGDRGSGLRDTLGGRGATPGA